MYVGMLKVCFVVEWYDVHGMVLVSPSKVVTLRTFQVSIAFQNLTYVVVMLTAYSAFLASLSKNDFE